MILFLIVLTVFCVILYYFARFVASSAKIWYNELKDTDEYKENFINGERIGAYIIDKYREYIKKS